MGGSYNTAGFWLVSVCGHKRPWQRSPLHLPVCLRSVFIYLLFNYTYHCWWHLGLTWFTWLFTWAKDIFFQIQKRLRRVEKYQSQILPSHTHHIHLPGTRHPSVNVGVIMQHMFSLITHRGLHVCQVQHRLFVSGRGSSRSDGQTAVCGAASLFYACGDRSLEQSWTAAQLTQVPSSACVSVTLFQTLVSWLALCRLHRAASYAQWNP